MKISFTAYEYCQDEMFRKVNYGYSGSCETGWKIFRNERLFETLGSGYVLLKTLYCGICSTDIARANLPFPLPQITGHEIVALYRGNPVVVDINASHAARAARLCYYCQQSMANHCPDRLTLGIDRLPGGFSPYVLAPKNGIYALPKNFPLKVAAVIEPFAAALHAVKSMKIEDHTSIGIVGPKRLGLLLILALALHRKKTGLNFTISGIVRHLELIETCLLFGADHVVMTNDLDGDQVFDIVYDTSGTVAGFELSVQLAKNALHVKSTHGLAVAGFTQMTRLVIDELSLRSLDVMNSPSLMATLKNKNHMLIDENLPSKIRLYLGNNINAQSVVIRDCLKANSKEMKAGLAVDGFSKFDAVIVSSIECLNNVISEGVVRAKGDVFWCQVSDDLPPLWSMFFEKKLRLYSSRCGDFSQALTLIEQNVEYFSTLIARYITDCFALEEINQAFDVARRDKRSIKLLIKHSESFQ